jgi:hypothetical protein
MGKRGPKPKDKVDLIWRPELAYAIGLLVTDGNLSSDGRHITFTSKDIEQIENFNKCLDISPKLGKTISGYDGKSAHRVQFGSTNFFNFLVSTGLTPAKSKTIGKVYVPSKYFWDYVRGCFDGDGCFYSYWDPRWRSSHMFYLEFVSASEKHILWLRAEIKKYLNILGHITKDGRGAAWQLKYAKKESVEIIKKMYYNPKVICLSRKRQKIAKALEIERKQQKEYARVLKLADRLP